MDQRRTVRAFGWLLAAALPLLLAARCHFGYSSDDPPPPQPFPAYVGIDSFPEKVDTSSIALQGQAECPDCFASDWVLNSCPAIDCPSGSGFDMAWRNHATGAGGPVTHGVAPTCNCPIFSYGYCYSACRHVWWATVPLAFGMNDVEISITGSGYDRGSAVAHVQRVPLAPQWVSVQPGAGSVTLSWSAVDGATSYNLYWSTTQYGWSSLMTRIPAVSSPYTQSGLASGVTIYYYVTALAGDAESFDSLQAQATPN